MRFVSVERIQVFSDRILFDICIHEPRFRYTTPYIAEQAALLRPNLPIHACINSKGRLFGSVMENTSMPHLIEHCTIDFLTEQTSSCEATFVGTSRWLDPETGKAQIQISMEDDLAVLRAFKSAVILLENEVICK